MMPVPKSHRMLSPRLESVSVNTRVFQTFFIGLVSGESSVKTAYSGACACIVFSSYSPARGGSRDRLFRDRDHDRRAPWLLKVGRRRHTLTNPSATRQYFRKNGRCYLPFRPYTRIRIEFGRACA